LQSTTGTLTNSENSVQIDT